MKEDPIKVAVGYRRVVLAFFKGNWRSVFFLKPYHVSRQKQNKKFEKVIFSELPPKKLKMADFGSKYLKIDLFRNLMSTNLNLACSMASKSMLKLQITNIKCLNYIFHPFLHILGGFQGVRILKIDQI